MKYFILFLSLSLFSLACSDDKDDNPPPAPIEEGKYPAANTSKGSISLTIEESSDDAPDLETFESITFQEATVESGPEEAALIRIETASGPNGQNDGPFLIILNAQANNGPLELVDVYRPTGAGPNAPLQIDSGASRIGLAPQSYVVDPALNANASFSYAYDNQDVMTIIFSDVYFSAGNGDYIIASGVLNCDFSP